MFESFPPFPYQWSVILQHALSSPTLKGMSYLGKVHQQVGILGPHLSAYYNRHSLIPFTSFIVYFLLATLVYSLCASANTIPVQ